MKTNFDGSAADMPALAQLNRATLLAAAIAGGVLVTTVLPAEYGIDPTGIGRLLGLTEMGEMKKGEPTAEGAAPAAGVAAPVAVTNADASEPGTESSRITMTLAPNQGGEVKATMEKDATIEYDWSTGGGKLNFDLHGEPPGAAEDEYTTHGKGASVAEKGTFRAPFGGTHGWFWRNRTSAPVTVTVSISGGFSKFERKK